MLGIYVLEARFGHYLFALHDLAELRVEILPPFMGAGLGAWLSLRRTAGLPAAMLWSTIGFVLGGLTGAVLGAMAWGSEEGTWAGGIAASSVGLIAGFALGLSRRGKRGLASVPAAVSLAAAGWLTACGAGGLPDLPDSEPIEIPDPAEVDAVVFLLGDAGALDAERSPLIPALSSEVERWSTDLAADSAVSIVYLGDLVYPVGVRDRDHPDFPVDSARLWNEIGLVGGPAARAHHTAGLFLAGNHDWGNRSGEGGLTRLQNIDEQLRMAREGGLAVALLPEAGHPGPVVRDLRDNVRLILLDTHWFLQERSSSAKGEFFDRVAEALRSAGDRHVIMAAHHPVRSAGPHGVLLPGNKAFGLAFLLKKSGTLVQDLNSPAYSDFLDRLRRTFRDTDKPPLIFAGGHDHSLQVMAGEQVFDPVHNLVSGSGSKVTSVTNAPGLRYAAARPGYMMLVFRKNDAVDLFVVAGDPGRLRCTGESNELAECMRAGVDSMDVVHSETLLYPVSDSRATDATVTEVTADELDEMPPPIGSAAAVRTIDLSQNLDSLEASPGATYPAGRLRRLVFGDLNRDLWGLRFMVPVLDLDSVGGGLSVDEMSGGKQTPGIKLEARDGTTYQFRSLVKDPSRALPEPLRETPVDYLMDGQMAAQFPLAAMVVAELLESADILVAKPRPVIMPDDPRLGPYRAAFAGRMGWLELRPNEGEQGESGFAGSTKIVGGDEIYSELADDPTAYIDPQKMVRARLIDMWVGDWDRHSDQWRWARFNDPNGTRWEPIPKDRDWAFARMDGALSVISAVFLRRYVGFSDRFPPVDRLASSGYRVDHAALAGLSRADFIEEAMHLQRVFSDSVITSALRVLPASYQQVEEERLLRSLIERREHLVELAVDFYQLLAETLQLQGTSGFQDTFTCQALADGRVRLRHSVEGPDSQEFVRLDRALVPAETREIVIQSDEEEDVLPDSSECGISVRRTDQNDEEDRAY